MSDTFADRAAPKTIVGSLLGHEVRTLLAVDEGLPTEDEEDFADEIRRDTPISMQMEEMEAYEATVMDQATYRFHRQVIRTIDPGPRLYEEYYFKDFTVAEFQNRECLKYLTSEMKKLDFYIAYNQWHSAVGWREGPVRMRMAVVTRFHRNTEIHHVYHRECCKYTEDDWLLTTNGYSKALIETKAPTTPYFIELVAEVPELFFCKKCEHFIFDAVEYMVGPTWNIPPDDVWPRCSNMLQCTWWERDSSVNLRSHKVIGIISPQLPAEDDSETDVSIDE